MKTLVVITWMSLLTWSSMSAQTAEDRPVFGEDGSVQFSTETLRLLSDSNYRSEVYPLAYHLDQVPNLLEAQNLTLALWTLINLYPKNARQIGPIVCMLAQKGVRAQHYLDAFYTYAFADPEIFHFNDEGDMYLQNPLRMETKLESCKTLVVYTEKYLQTQVSHE